MGSIHHTLRTMVEGLYLPFHLSLNNSNIYKLSNPTNYESDCNLDEIQ